MRRIGYICCILLICGQYADAQRVYYRNFTVKEGLISNTVYDMIQDEEGFMWFSTEAGVSRYDGISFFNYGKKEGLGDNEIFNLYQDQSGKIWFLPFNGNISYYEKGKIYNVDSDSSLQKICIQGTYTIPVEDEFGRLWAGTSGRNLVIYGDSIAGRVKIQQPRAQIRWIQGDSLMLTAGKQQHVYTFDRLNPFLDSLVLKHTKPFTAQQTKKELPLIDGNNLNDALEDSFGNNWYSSLGKGVYVKSKNEIGLYDTQSGLSHDHVYSLLLDREGNLFCGFKDGTLDRYKASERSTIQLTDLGYNRILDQCAGEKLWVACDKGLYAVNTQTMSNQLYKKGAIKCVELLDSTVYFGASNGLYRAPIKAAEEAERIYNKRSLAILPISHDSIYIGTNTGCMLYLQDTMISMSTRHSMLSGRIRAIERFSDGTIIYATHGDGILIQSKNDYALINSSNGLSSDISHCLAVQNDSIIWLGTNIGAHKIKFRDKNYSNPLVDIYTSNNGLKSNYVNDIQCIGQEVYIATDGGVSRFEMQKEANSMAPKAYFTSINVNDAHVDLSERFELNHDQNRLRINCSAISFSSGEHTKFKYRMNGLEDDWHIGSDKIMAYQGLQPGEYTFEVLAVDAQGKSIMEPTMAVFSIKKPFWQTWWFILLSVIFLSMALTSMIIAIIRSNQRKSLSAQNRLLEEKNLLIEEERIRSDNLLLNILPADVATELKEKGKVRAKSHQAVTVFFSDFKEFSSISGRLSPEALVEELDYCFKHFDQIIEKYKLEKIKTIGDAYMCAAGLNEQTTKDPRDVVYAAMEILEFLANYAKRKKANGQEYFEARIGIHTGKAVSGVVGSKKFAYDIWGDTVNIASRVETASEPGKINISSTTLEYVKDSFVYEYRGKVEIKNMGEMDMYFITDQKPKA